MTEYKSSEKARKMWEKEGLMSPKKYEHWAKKFDEVRKAHPELKEDLDKIQDMLKSKIYKMMSPVYHEIYQIAKRRYVEYLVKERAVRFKWEHEHPGQKFDHEENRPYVSSVMYGLMCNISDMHSHEGWFFSGPEDGDD